MIGGRVHQMASVWPPQTTTEAMVRHGIAARSRLRTQSSTKQEGGGVVISDRVLTVAGV